MDGIGSFGLPEGLSAIPAQLDTSDDKQRWRKTSKSAAASATATTSTSRRSSSTSSSVNSRSSVVCYPMFQSFSRKGDETKMSKMRSENDDLSSIEDSDDDDDDDNDEVPLASLAGSKSKSKGSKTSSGLRIGESNARNDRRCSNSGGAKRRKLVESRSSSDVSSTTSPRHNIHQSGANDGQGRRQKEQRQQQQQPQQQRRQLGIGAFLSSSSSQKGRAHRKNSATTSAPANTLESTSAATTINANDNSLDRAETETNGNPATHVDSIPVAPSDNGGTSSASDGGIVDEDQIDPKQYSNAVQFGMQHCAVPPNTLSSEISNQTDKLNVLSALFRRSVSTAYGRGYPPKSWRPDPTDALRRFANASDKWTKCETVRLPAHGTVALEFDRLGVLLATADTRGIITVYDFDELCAADIAARRVACRARAAHTISNSGNSRQATSIGPVLAFSTRSTSRISCMKWNPYCEDLLVVSFATDCRIRIYDLNSGSEAEGPNHIVLSDADSLRGHLRTEGNISILQLPSTGRKVSSLLAGGARGTLRLWNFPRNIARGQKKSQNTKLVWSISPFSSSSQISADSEGISSICHLGTCKGPSTSSRENGGLVLVGGTKGSLAIIDLDKLSKKAFSTKLTPTVVWSSNIVRHIARRRLVDAVLPSNSWMGIKKMALWGDNSSSGGGRISSTSSRSVPAEEARITIATNCGWALNASIRGLGRSGNTSSNRSADASATLCLQIIFKTATTKWLNSDLEEIFVGENALTFSLPPVPTPVCALPGQSSLLAIASVKRNIKVMSNKDKRVLSSLPEAEIERLSRDDGDAILLVDLDSASSEPKDVVVVSRIPIGNGTPHVLAVHPGGQWMIVGSSGEGRQELTLVCQRCTE